MRFSIATLLLMTTVSAQAGDLRVQRQTTVVYDGLSTVSAEPYYRRLNSRQHARKQVVAPDGSHALALEERLPLTNERLRLGTPDLRVQAGLVTPLFVMGMDQISLTWFEQTAHRLADIGAQGVVIEASSATRWHLLQQTARDLGITLTLLRGDSLADGYGLETYPVVIVSPQLAQEGFGE